MARDPNAVAAKWAQNLSAAGPSIQAGVEAVTTPPGQAAARQVDAYAAGVVAAKQKWARNTAAVPLSDWQQATIQKGVPRIASGAQAAQPKMQQFMQKLLPFIDAKVNALPPRGNLEQNITRATKFMRDMSTFSN